MSDAESQLEAFLSRYTPELAATARACRVKMRALVPGATELVYDNYNALVIGFGASEKVKDCALSLALYPKWVTLFFLRGVDLPDPTERLEGAGVTVRGIRLRGPETLDEPDVRALVALAQELGGYPAAAVPKLVIKSISAKQRPRRPGG
jgi:hypothetical protein